MCFNCSCTHQVMPGVCADTFPKLHPTGRLPTKREKDLAVNEFAETYYKNVRAGICGNSLVFLYVEKISSVRRHYLLFRRSLIKVSLYI